MIENSISFTYQILLHLIYHSIIKDTGNFTLHRTVLSAVSNSNFVLAGFQRFGKFFIHSIAASSISSFTLFWILKSDIVPSFSTTKETMTRPCTPICRAVGG